MKRSQVIIAAIIGNVLEHYDAALFGLLAPFLSPLFFPQNDPVSALIFTYALIPLGIVAKPIGALFFGILADHYGRRPALLYSMTGTAIATFSIGLLPTAQEIGFLAPIGLALLKLIQSFFAAGETPGGAIFILEKTEKEKRPFASSLYDASTIIGILIASILVFYFSHHWRTLFFLGAFTGFMGLIIRFNTEEERIEKTPIIENIWAYKKNFLAIVLAAGFSYMTYSFATTFMNGYIPLITHLSKEDMIEGNSWLLGLDLLLLPCFGWVAGKWGEEKTMLTALLGSVFLSFPLFSLLNENSTLLTISILRSMIIFFGTAFAAPYHAWALKKFPKEVRAKYLCFSYVIGAQLFGSTFPAISLYLYQKTDWMGAPLLYFIPFSLITLLNIYRNNLKISNFID